MNSEKAILSMVPIINYYDPNEPTIIGYFFREAYVFPVFDKIPNFYLINIYAYEATYFNYQLAVKTNIINYVSFIGHGDENNFYAIKPFFNNEMETLFKFRSIDEVKDKIFHLCSCYTGLSLGINIIKNGGISFLGYNDIVGGVDDNSILNEILMCDAQIDIVLSKGKTVKEAYDAAIEAYEKMAIKYESQGKIRWASLFRNHKNSLCSPVTNSQYGNADAKIF